MGWIEFLILVGIFVTIGMLLATNAAIGHMGKSAGRMRHVVDRRQMLAAESARYAESKRTVVLASTAAESAVEAVATVTQAGHSVAAATVFGTLESLPLAKGPAKIVRGVHDSIIDNVYDSITALNKGIGSAIRRADPGRPKTPETDSSDDD